MATITVIIKSNALQLTDVLIRDLGVIIPNTGGSETFLEVEEVRELGASLYLAGLVTDDAHGAGSSTLILNDGTSDIAQADAVDFLLSRALADAADEFGVVRTNSSNQVDQSLTFDGTATLTSVKLGGDLDANSNKITGLATPTLGTDATNKDYVDNAVNGLKWKQPVRALADANIAALTGLPTVDGVSLGSGDRVLLTAQTSAIQNGIWTVAAGAWARPADFPTGGSASSAAMLVQEGSTYADQTWVCTDDIGSDVIDTDPLTFVQQGASTAIITRLQFSSSQQVPGGGVRYLKVGDVATSAAGQTMMRSGIVSGASVSVDQADATNDYKVSIKVNGGEVATLALTSGSTAARSIAISGAYADTDSLSVSMERTAGSGRSAFGEIVVMLELRE